VEVIGERIEYIGESGMAFDYGKKGVLEQINAFNNRLIVMLFVIVAICPCCLSARATELVLTDTYELEVLSTPLSDWKTISNIEYDSIENISEYEANRVNIENLNIDKHINMLSSLVKDKGIDGFCFGEYTSADELEMISSIKEVKLVSIKQTVITKDFIKPLSKLCNLTHVELRDCGTIPDQIIVLLAKIPELRYLDLRGSYVSKAGFQYIEKESNIKIIRVGYVSNPTLPHSPVEPHVSLNNRFIDHLPAGIEYIELGGVKLVDADCVKFKRLVNLKGLSIADGRITSSGLEFLTGLDRLVHLSLPGYQFGNENTSDVINKFTNLISLNLGESNISDVDLKRIGAMNKLESLRLHHCDKLSDQGLEVLKELTRLQHLDLSGCKGVTDKGLLNAVGCESLRIISLVGAQGVQFKSKAFRKMRAIEELDLSSCNVGDEGLLIIGALQNLKKLKMAHCGKISDSGLRHIMGLDSMEVLILHNCNKISLRDVRLLDLKKLKNLDISECNHIDDTGAKSLKAMPSLVSLSVGGEDSKMTPQCLESIAQLPNLKELMICIPDRYDEDDKRIKVNDAGFKYLKKCRLLSNLYIDCSISDNAIRSISCLNNLRYLHISGAKEFDDVALAAIGKLNNLSHLCLRDIDGVASETFGAIGGLRMLQYLEVSNSSQLTDTDLQKLIFLQKLKHLNLGGARSITDKGLKHIGKLETLAWLDLRFCNKELSVQGLISIQSLSNLHHLNLDYCEGISGDVSDVFIQFKKLRSLFVKKTGLSNKAIEKIKTAMPECYVIHDRN